MGREPLFGESNQIFIKSNPDEIKKLQRENIFEIDNKRESIIRLVTNYRTEESDVIGFLNSLDK